MAITQTGTGGIKDDAVTAGKIPANAVGSSEIADEAVTLAKLPHGTSSNDGKFLRANNGADPTFETVTGTTINNNADNRVITGSGTANTLNGESNLTYDGTTLALKSNDARITIEDNTNGTVNSALRIIPFNGVNYIQSGTDLTHNSASTLAFSSIGGGTEWMRIDSSGKVGIGTSSPTVNAQIQSSGTNSLLKLAGTSAGSGINDGLDVGINGVDGILWNRENGSIQFATNNSERMRIDSNGRLQHGSNPSNLGLARLNIVDANGYSINLSRNTGAAANNNERLGAIAFHPGLGSQSTTTGGASIEAFAEENQSGSSSATRLVFYTKPSGTGPGSNPVERLRLNSTGNLSWTGAGNQYVQFNNSGDLSVFQTGGTSAANHGMLYFKDGGGAFCGQITSHGTNHTTSYNTNSDYRLKENESSITDGITRLKQLKPYRFDWKSSGARVDGFFAHEAQAVVPESVVGTKDEMQSILYQEGDVLPEGKKVGDFKEYSKTEPKYQGIDQAKLVPLLTAALQEAVAKIETLETKVAALEAS
mgnify:CR=1 FL=1